MHPRFPTPCTLHCVLKRETGQKTTRLALSGLEKLQVLLRVCLLNGALGNLLHHKVCINVDGLV